MRVTISDFLLHHRELRRSMPQPTSRHRLPPRHCCAPPGTARRPSGCPRSASDAATRLPHRRARARQPPTPLRRLHGGLPSEYSDSFGRASTARSEPAVTPPSEHSDSSSRHRRPPCHRCATQDAARRPSGCPRPVVDVSCPLRARRRLTPRAERAHCLRAAATSVTSPHYSSSPRRPSPRHSPISCRPSAPTPPSPPSLSQRCDASCPLARIGAGSRRAPSSRAACAPLPAETSPSYSASVMLTHHASAREHADLPRRRCRFRPRRRCASASLAPLPARRRPTPRAEPARRVRASATPVTSSRYSSCP